MLVYPTRIDLCALIIGAALVCALTLSPSVSHADASPQELEKAEAEWLARAAAKLNRQTQKRLDVIVLSRTVELMDGVRREADERKALARRTAQESEKAERARIASARTSR